MGSLNSHISKSKMERAVLHVDPLKLHSYNLFMLFYRLLHKLLDILIEITSKYHDSGFVIYAALCNLWRYNVRNEFGRYIARVQVRWACNAFHTTPMHFGPVTDGELVFMLVDF